MVWKSVSVVVGVVVSDSVLVMPPSESDSVLRIGVGFGVVAARVWVRVDCGEQGLGVGAGGDGAAGPRWRCVQSVAVELSVSVGVIVVGPSGRGKTSR